MTNKYTNEEVGAMSPKDFRSIVRKDEWRDMNRDVCRGYAQFGMVALPAKYVSEFLLFCNRNPRPCYVSDVTEPGDPHPKLMAPDADLRTDIPKYLISKGSIKGLKQKMAVGIAQRMCIYPPDYKKIDLKLINPSLLLSDVF